MKITNALVLGLGVIFSTGSLAQQDTQTDRMEKLKGTYIGADYTFNNEIELITDSDSNIEDSDSSFNLNIGQDLVINDNFVVGLEGAYSILGKTNYRDIINIEGSGISLNIKPKYYFNETTAYVGALIGLGSYDLDIDAPTSNFKLLERKTGYHLGVEAGYEFENNIVLTGGFRQLTLNDVDGVDINYLSTYVGAKYKF